MPSVQDVLSRKTGVIVGDDVRHLFDYAQKHGFALPAINVTTSSVVIAALQAAQDNKAPIILQVSHGGAAMFAGKGQPNKNNEASIAGAVAAAHYIRAIAPFYNVPVVIHTDHCAKKILGWLDGCLDADEEYYKKTGEPLFSSHMIDLSEESHDDNIATTAKYFERAAKMNQWLEMEIGMTGGEEDGVDNSNADESKLVTAPEDVFRVHQTLSKISPNFSIAAAFGNVHGMYAAPIKLKPELLQDHQEYAKKHGNTDRAHPLYLVFHGGSGSADKEYEIAIKNGVVKVNVDTSCQYAYTSGLRDYFNKFVDYLKAPTGNPEGENKPNKKYFDPRVICNSAEKTMSAEVTRVLKVFNCHDLL